MHYYELRHSTDLSVVGAYPQVGVSSSYDSSYPHSYQHFRDGQYHDVDPDIDDLILLPHARLTDFLSFDGGIVMPLFTPRFVSLLSSFKLDTHRLYRGLIDGVHEVFWLQMVSHVDKEIDFARSELRARILFEELLPEYIESDEIDSYEAAERVRGMKWFYEFEVERLAVKETFDRELDMFMLPLLSPFLICSERLAERVEREKMTGCELVMVRGLEV